MADALISATIQVALETAISLASERIGLLLGFKEDLASMTRSLELIRAMLADAEVRQGQDERAVQEWLKSLEGVAFDADNVLDELNYEFLRHRVQSRNQLKPKVCCFFSFSNCISLRWRMASKVRGIILKLKSINQEANEMGLVSRISRVVTAAEDTSSRQTHSVVEPIIGRASDESKILKMLLNSSEKVVSVIPITGMGGLGKTTLAKSIYNNKKIDRRFAKKIWVCVSKKIGIVDLFKLILVQLTGEKVEVDDLNVVVEKIREKLGEDRYFLVLDDVWNHEQDLWNDFFTTLKGINPTNGSWCLVTTRLEQLASTVCRLLMIDAEPYFLGRLPNADCWSILKEKAIAGEEVPEELKAIRDRVIKRCDGLPLAASVIGGLLRLSAKEEWLSIVEKSLLSGDQSGVEQILKVSFDYLSPTSVKKCFAYCSIFSKNTEIERNSLIELWMAEGFLQSNLENKTVMEKTGDKYIRVLLQSSLLEERSNGWGAVFYKMHDLVHDLAELVSKSESINLETDVVDNNCQVRYLAANSCGEKTVKIIESTSTSLRTLFLMRSISCVMLSKFKNLHVLNLSWGQFRELPTSIRKLIHLRYLDLSNSKIQTLSESLCKLYNLQTLRIIQCKYLKSLPKGMSNLISLRHLYYNHTDAEFRMPLEMGQLTCLQTLEFFNIGQGKGRQIEELGYLNDLKGKLKILNLELVKGKEGAEKANLIGKAYLVGLEFLWGSTNREGDNCDEDVLEGLLPNPNLQELKIENFMDDQFPDWFMNLSTRQLVELSLSGCERCRELPAALGQLQFLQHLKLDGLKNIRCIGLSFYGIDDRCSNISSSQASRKLFSALKTLGLSYMENLVEWKGAEEEVEAFPMLESLSIVNCSQLTTAPSHFPSLKELKIIKNAHVLVLKNILLSEASSTSTLSSLKIEGMAGLTCVSDMVVPVGIHNNPLGSLNHLTLNGCPNLTSLRGFGGTSLERLDIFDCENLRELTEGLFGLQSLRSLSICRCPNIEEIIIPKSRRLLTSLRYLSIARCGVTHLPGHMLNSCTAFWNLRVFHCPNLVSFPLDLHHTPSLSSIALYKCPKLTTKMMPKGFGFLTKLRNLEIGQLSDDEEFDWSELTSSSALRVLHLYGLPHMESLPDQLQYLTTLTMLKLQDFGGIEALPDGFGNLASLERLHLRNCKKLEYLPSMDAMERLAKLRYLCIEGCPLLKERCNTPSSSSSSEWSKISLIPERHID